MPSLKENEWKFAGIRKLSIREILENFICLMRFETQHAENAHL